jgi:hypothetical protein
VVASYPTVRPGHGIIFDDIAQDQMADNIDDLNTRLALLDPLAVRTGCRLRRAAAQSVANSTSVTISWDTEDQDTDGYIVVTGTTVTIPTGLGGLYAITFHAVGVTTTGRLTNWIEPTSGIAGTPGQLRSVSSGVDTFVTLGVTIPLLAGDSFISRVFHSNGAAANFTAWQSCYRVGV